MTLPAEVQRIGVLTGGGDCAGLNAVIRAVVKTAILKYGWEVIGIEDGFEGLILPGKLRPLSLQAVRGILPRGGTILGTTNRADPFHNETLTESGLQVSDVSGQALARAAAAGLDALVVIGGDGSLRIAREMMYKGLRLVGVPKTIDNDIPGTQAAFGFDTALNTAMEALDRLHTTAESHHRILILEVMGREAGWIALQAGIAGGADVILIPEIPFNLREIIRKIQERERRGAKFSLVVAAEGARPAGGQALFREDREVGGAPRLGGIGEALAGELRRAHYTAVRVTVLGHLQRGGSPSAFDRLLASRFGAQAVHLLAQGRFGVMVALQGERIVAVPLETLSGRQKFVPLDSDIVHTALDLDINLGESRDRLEGLAAGGGVA